MRLVPDGVAGRLAVLLAAALLVANAVAIIVLASERERLGREARLEATLERIVDAVPRIEADPQHARRVLRRLDRRFAEIQLADSPLVAVTSDDPRIVRIAERVGRELASLVGASREVRGALIERRPSGPAREGARGRDETERRWRRGREALALSIALHPEPSHRTSDGERAWLNVTIAASAPRDEGIPALLLVFALSLVCVLGGALLYMRRLTRPLRELANAARAAGRGDRTARVPERGARELREAATAFNNMQARIARFDAERTRTLAAVGHDLRTPITSLRIRAEMLEDESRVPMVRTLDEMRVMADGLVAYARGDGDGEARERTDLVPLLEHLCAERGARWKGGPDLAADVRPVALARAVGNLIDNAIRYAGTASVTLERSDNEAMIVVEDEGPGIPSERLETVTEPFVRGEASRSAETGGAGLGLSITRQILVTHGGALHLTNRAPRGLRVEARLPAAD